MSANQTTQGPTILNTTTGNSSGNPTNNTVGENPKPVEKPIETPAAKLGESFRQNLNQQTASSQRECPSSSCPLKEQAPVSAHGYMSGFAEHVNSMKAYFEKNPNSSIKDYNQLCAN